MNDMDDIEFKIARLDLRPGDILVIRCKQHLPMETIARMRAAFLPVTKDHKIMVLDGDMDLAVLTAAEIEARSVAPTSEENAA